VSNSSWPASSCLRRSTWVSGDGYFLLHEDEEAEEVEEVGFGVVSGVHVCMKISISIILQRYVMLSLYSQFP
jgi:hypothetical protein